MDYTQLVETLGKRPSKKLDNNTYARRMDNGHLAIKLHDTDILEFTPRGKIIARMGGWNTLTTRDRLNSYLPDHRIYTKSSLPYWTTGVPFTDGDWLTWWRKGKEYGWNLHAQRKDNKKDVALKKRIAAYAQKCADAVPLALPGPGDCFYCQMVVESPEKDKGKPLGDATHNCEHLLMHIEEGYVVPSLVAHALKEHGYGRTIWPAIIFGQTEMPNMIKSARREVKKSVQRYVAIRIATNGKGTAKPSTGYA